MTELGDSARRAEIARLAREQRRDDAATQAGKIIRENCMTSQYGLDGEYLLGSHVTPAARRGSDTILDRAEEALMESIRIA